MSCLNVAVENLIELLDLYYFCQELDYLNKVHITK